jgi:hypothetical protein
MNLNQPKFKKDVYFYPKKGITDERIGIAIPEQKTILLKRTEISFDDVLLWVYLPQDPHQVE